MFILGPGLAFLDEEKDDLVAYLKTL